MGRVESGHRVGVVGGGGPGAAAMPVAALAAGMRVVAGKMAESDKCRHRMRAPSGDRAVLLITFALTVLVDLTVAIEVGVVLAAVLFMHRMSEAVEVQADLHLVEEDVSDSSPRDFVPMQEYELPPGVAASLIRGPFFFGVAMRLGETLDRIGATPKVLILRLRAVPIIDATGVSALETMIERCERNGTKVIVTALQPQPARILEDMGVLARVARAPDFASAIEMAREMVKER